MHTYQEPLTDLIVTGRGFFEVILEVVESVAQLVLQSAQELVHAILVNFA